MTKFTCFFVLIIVLSSCKKEPLFETFVEPELQIYLDRFIQEAEKRGVSFDTEGMNIQFVDEIVMNGETFCGYAFHSKRIDISTKGSCWEGRTDLEKENLFFHELGHALAMRQHTSQKLPNGMFASMMCGSTGSDPCNNFRAYYKYQDEVREYYLDELIKAVAPVPDWAKSESLSRSIFTDNFDGGIDDWGFFISGGDTSNQNGYEFYRDSVNYFSAPYSLALSIGPQVVENGRGVWFYRLNLDGVENCTTLKSRVDVFAQGITEGWVSLGMSLQEKKPDGVLSSYIFLQRSITLFERADDKYEDFEFNVFCLPEETEAVIVYLRAKSETAAKVYFDNLEIEFWD